MWSFASLKFQFHSHEVAVLQEYIHGAWPGALYGYADNYYKCIETLIFGGKAKLSQFSSLLNFPHTFSLCAYTLCHKYSHIRNYIIMMHAHA